MNTQPLSPLRHAAGGAGLEFSACPAWAWRSALTAGALTAVTFLALPYLELASSPPAQARLVTDIESLRLSPPVLPVRDRIAVREPVVEKRTPKPRLDAPRPRLEPLMAALTLDMPFGSLAGDFALDFRVGPEASDAAADDGVFELADLDSTPEPLVRLQPGYPVHARMRRMEGTVVLEFVVGADGRTGDIRVIAAEPGEVFVGAATRAAARWRFRPGTRAGLAVAVRVRQQLTFRLED